MTQALKNLMNLLNLERIEQGIFRGESEHIGLPQVYGGQVIGQALSAARYTVTEERTVHSFHSYFLHAGDPEKPIIYDVENLRDGKSFSTRRVKAIQYGRPIFYLTASYHGEEPGFEHQTEMPDAPDPESLKSEKELWTKFEDYMPEKLFNALCGDKALEVRPVNVVDPFKPEVFEPRQYVWFRANGKVPDNQLIHQYLLGYASDWGFITTSLHPHGVTLVSPGLQLATIDHSMWFHRPFRMDEWLLFAIESPNASNSRGLVRGQIYNQQGSLVATAMQEGLIRYNRPQ